LKTVFVRHLKVKDEQIDWFVDFPWGSRF
jgi:hypothetical protein